MPPGCTGANHRVMILLPETLPVSFSGLFTCPSRWWVFSCSQLQLINVWLRPYQPRSSLAPVSMYSPCRLWIWGIAGHWWVCGVGNRTAWLGHERVAWRRGSCLVGTAGEGSLSSCLWRGGRFRGQGLRLYSSGIRGSKLSRDICPCIMAEKLNKIMPVCFEGTG